MHKKEAFKQAKYTPKITYISLLKLKLKETKKGIMVNINLIHKRETRNKKLNQKNHKN